MATVKQVLEQVDAMLPNQYTTAEKRRWLLQAEGFVVREVHQPHAGGEETEVPPEDAGEDTVLTSCTATMWRRRSTTPTGRWSGTTMLVPLGTTPC